MDPKNICGVLGAHCMFLLLFTVLFIRFSVYPLPAALHTTHCMLHSVPFTHYWIHMYICTHSTVMGAGFSSYVCMHSLLAAATLRELFQMPPAHDVHQRESTLALLPFACDTRPLTTYPLPPLHLRGMFTPSSLCASPQLAKVYDCSNKGCALYTSFFKARGDMKHDTRT